MAHRGMPRKTKERLGRRKDDPELGMLRAPCRGCDKTVSLAPSSTNERFGVRCLFCLSPYCVPCGTKHFQRKPFKPRKMTKADRNRRNRRSRLHRLPTCVWLKEQLKGLEKRMTEKLKRAEK